MTSPSPTLSRRVADLYSKFISDSFYRNSLYLLANMAVGTGTGFFFVIVCAHFYPQRDFGYATALLGALGVATGFSNIGMNRTLVRFMGKSETQSEDLVTGIAIVSACSLVAGLILSHYFSSFGLKHADIVVKTVFVATVFLMSIKALFDSVFVALRESSGTLIENSVFNVARLVFPMLVVGSGYLGIFSSQLAAVVLAVAASLILLWRYHDFSFFVRPTRRAMKGKWRFAIGSYTSDLTGGLPSSVLPIIVVARIGPVAGALWYVSTQIVNVLLSVSASINQAMFAEMANAEGSINKFMKRASASMFGVLVPLSGLVFLLAPQILEVFHHNYVHAEHVLRLMTVFALIGVANFIAGSILQVYKMVVYITVVNVVNALVVVVFCLTVAHTLNGVAIGWVLGEVANLLLFVGGGVWVVRKHHGDLVVA